MSDTLSDGIDYSKLAAGNPLLGGVTGAGGQALSGTEISAALAPVTGALPQPSAPSTSSSGAAQSLDETIKKSVDDTNAAFTSNLATNLTALSQARAMGFQAGAAGAGIAGQGAQLGAEGSAAAIEQARIAALIASGDALARAKQIAADQAQAVSLHLVGPEAERYLKGSTAAFDYANQTLDRVTQLRQVDFADSPLTWMWNHAVMLPILEDRAADAVETVKQKQSALTDQIKTFSNESVVDAVMNSADTVQRAALLGQAQELSGKLNSVAERSKALQIEKSGWDLSVSGSEAATRAAGQSVEASAKAQELAVQRGHLEIAQKNFEQEQAKNELNIKYLRASTDEKLELVKSHRQLYELQAGAIQDRKKVFEDRDSLVKPFLSELGMNPDAYSSRNFQGNDKQQSALIDMANHSAVSGGSLAPTAFDALQSWEASGLPTTTLPDSQRATFAAISDLREKWVRLGSAPDIKTHAPGLKGVELEDFVRRQVQKEIEGGQDRATSSPFFAPQSLTRMVSTDWGAKNPILQAMKPMTFDQQGKPIESRADFGVISQMANQLIEDKKLSESQAVVAIREIAQNSLIDANRGFGLKRFAIPVDINRYGVPLRDPGVNFTGSVTTHNFADPASILTYLRLLKAEKDSKKMNEGNFIAGP